MSSSFAGRLWPASAHDQALIPELLTESTNLLDRRRERPFVGQQGIGATLWVIIVLGGIVTVGYACAFEVHSLRTQFAVTGMMAAMFGLMAFLIIAMDHPLWGDVSVPPDALMAARDNINRSPAKPASCDVSIGCSCGEGFERVVGVKSIQTSNPTRT